MCWKVSLTIKIACLITILFFLSGCTVLKAGGNVIVGAGKFTVAVLDTTGKVVTATGKTVVSLVEMPGKKRTISLVKRGNDLFVNVVFNRKVKGLLLIDTGSSITQVSIRIVNALGIDPHKGERVMLSLAGVGTIGGTVVQIKEISVEKTRVQNNTVVVLDNDTGIGDDGLLGMSFLNNFVFRIDAKKGELILEKKH